MLLPRRIQENKQCNEHFINVRTLEMPKGSILQFVEYNSSLQALALSHFGHYYLNHTIHSFWTSFFRVSVQHWSPAQAKDAQMGGYSCGSSARLQKPAGTLPPAQSIHLVSWCSSTFSGLWWVYPRTYAKMVQFEWVFLVEWKMGPPNTHTHTNACKHTQTQITCFSWNDWQF